jgi:3-oxoacyl-(acyl-carrier-protein) synthase
MWFKHQVVQLGWPPASVYCVDSATRGSDAVPEVFRQLARDASATDSGLAALVIACDSQIDQETVDRWETEGSLFTPSRSQRLIPGEGAAGMLVTDLQRAQKTEGAAYAMLEPFFEARHAVSIDDSKRTDTSVLFKLTERACKAAAIAPTEVAMIVADTDDRANRMLELMGVASTAFPQLEDAAEVARAGPASGACGVVPAITALALARHHAIERAAPVLYVSNDDAHHRCTALVRPATVV